MTYTLGKTTHKIYVPGCNDDNSNPGCVSCGNAPDSKMDDPVCFLEGEMTYCSNRFEKLSPAKTWTGVGNVFANKDVAVYQKDADLAKGDGWHVSVNTEDGEVQDFCVVAPTSVTEMYAGNVLLDNDHAEMFISLSAVYAADLDVDGDSDLVLVFGDKADITPEAGIAIMFLYNDEISSETSNSYINLIDYEAAGNVCVEAGPEPVTEDPEYVEDDSAEEDYDPKYSGGCSATPSTPSDSSIDRALDNAYDQYRYLFRQIF